MSDKELIMYSRTNGCPFITTAKHVLHDYGIPYKEIFIDRDEQAKQRVLDWTGFLSVPTLVIAHVGDLLPYAPISHLPKGESPRGVDRGPMITEGTSDELEEWLAKNGFIEAADTGSA